MMKYERLNQNIAILNMHNHSFRSVKQLTDGKKTEDQVIDEIVHDIAEILDKIENGTLIELPCNVGDRFYQVVKGLPIYEWEVETIVFSNVYFPKNYVITAGRSKDLARWKFWSEDFGKTLFLTREEAEKRLKELQNG